MPQRERACRPTWQGRPPLPTKDGGTLRTAGEANYKAFLIGLVVAPLALETAVAVWR
jgi:hypothetical protein